MARSKIEPIQVAEGFGKALDHDDFVSVKGLIDPECVYTIGESTMTGPDEIADSYERNMTDGRKMLDELVWGESYVEQIAGDAFLVFFTDHIKHQNKSFIHRCKQKVTIGNSLRIVRIEHVDDPAESERLRQFYESVGIRQ